MYFQVMKKLVESAILWRKIPTDSSPIRQISISKKSELKKTDLSLSFYGSMGGVNDPARFRKIMYMNPKFIGGINQDDNTFWSTTRLTHPIPCCKDAGGILYSGRD